jgi:urease subunit gamma/beta
VTLLDEVRLEVLLGDGARLIVLVQPLGDGLADSIRPGEIRPETSEPTRPMPDGEHRTLTVRNGSARVVRVSSHYPFDRVNPRLEFDRVAAAGYRLDIPAGANVRWAPGETREIELIRYRGRIGQERTGGGGRAGTRLDTRP